MTLSRAVTHILLFYLLQGVTQGSSEQLYVEIPQSDGLLYSRHSNETDVPSLEDCAALCSEMPQCRSFTFSYQSCYLYDTPAPFLFDSTSLGDAKTYRSSYSNKLQDCGGNFTTDATGTLCYLIMDGDSNELSFVDAMSSCIDMNSVLASFESVDKLRKYRDVITAQIGSLHSTVWWVSGYDIGGKNRDWQWGDGQPIDSSFWRIYEPNGIVERCAEAHGGQLVLNDIMCTKKQNYICEKIIA